MYFDHREGYVIEPDDQCGTCTFMNQGIACPLLEALFMGFAYLDGDMRVKNCGFYVPFERHLRVLEGGADGKDTKA